jgi:hypothetical protein
MNGQQHVLHNVINAVSRYSAPSRHAPDDRYAIPQQFLVSSAIAGLSSGHQS